MAKLENFIVIPSAVALMKWVWWRGLNIYIFFLFLLRNASLRIWKYITHGSIDPYIWPIAFNSIDSEELYHCHCDIHTQDETVRQKKLIIECEVDKIHIKKHIF